MFSYAPLLKLLIDKKISKTELRKACDFTTVSLAKISKDDYIPLETLDRICKYLDCEIEDIIKHIK